MDMILNNTPMVEVISNETIKPSSPTPKHLQYYNLSLLDQLAPPTYVPIILFYTGMATTDSDGDHLVANVSKRLKASLSEVLTHFYPVAGRLKDNMMIDCNDDGVEYVETRFHKGSTVSDFMKLDSLHHLLPDNIEFRSVHDGPQLIVRVNKFDCGGTAVCVCMSHTIADGTAMTSFINSWAATARGAPTVVTPTFDNSLFPAREGVPSFTGLLTKDDREGKSVVTKRFVFDASNIAALRAKIFAGKTLNADIVDIQKYYPTRVEAVSALIWKIAAKAAAAAAAAASSSSSTKPSASSSVMKLSVNMRPRMNPPLSERSFGNLNVLSTSPPVTIDNIANNDPIIELEKLTAEIQEGINTINNSDSLKQFIGDEGVLRFQKFLHESLDGYNAEGVNAYTISSWCRFPFYEADFGWGKPTWVSFCCPPYKNLIILISTKDGEGIEAWVSLAEEDMAVFETDQELLNLLV